LEKHIIINQNPFFLLKIGFFQQMLQNLKVYIWLFVRSGITNIPNRGVRTTYNVLDTEDAVLYVPPAVRRLDNEHR
jgi:hypothetical protein